MAYESTTDFPSFEPKQRGELQRLERKIVAGFSSEESSSPRKFAIVRVLGSRYTAKHWDAVLAGFNQNAVILLPKSDPAKADHRVRVVQVGGLGAVAIVAQDGDKVNAASSAAIGVSTGYQDFFDDGQGGWWGPAV
jgi:hypothetical protein